MNFLTYTYIFSYSADSDSERRALSSNAFPTSTTISPYYNNVVLSDFIHIIRSPPKDST
jgi:hypothetical protein